MPEQLPPYRRAWQEVVAELDTSPERGLSEAEARKRLKQHGPNQLQEKARTSAWRILAAQFKSLVILLLVAAAALSFALGDWVEGVAVIAVIAINTAIGFFTEIQAVRSVEALRKMGSVSTRVRRDGQLREIPALELVPGDIVLVEGGDMVSADLRVIEASKLQAAEAALTGESAPVSKEAEAIGEERTIAERGDMLYKGTGVTRGSGAGVVVATGMNTELGHISSMVEEAESEATPLEKRLDALARRLVWVVLAIVALVAGLGALRGNDIWVMIETAIALAVASIPEGLPIVATIALSRGMLRMARRQALVRQLASVETLGSTSVICTDKTGTLTENRMTVQRVELADGAVERTEEGFSRDGQAAPEDGPFREAIKVGMLCNNASLEGDTPVGDPLEVALLEAGQAAGVPPRAELERDMREVREVAFETDTKMMATYHEDGDGIYVAVKGAPEPVLESCARVLTPEGEQELTQERREEWQERNRRLGNEGYRVLGVARKRAGDAQAEPYRDLALVGLLGLLDPPRMDIRPTIEQCHKAGIEIVMVTGDQESTALNVAHAVGIVDSMDTPVVHGRELKPPEQLSQEEERKLRETRIFARVSPAQKLDLIGLHQAAGHVVAMTGDGVNDAPALKKADIGVAMGERGTQVAREVADIVLKDDSFKTIVYAVEEGRVIFGNIRKFVLYLISCNIAEIIVIFVATLIGTAQMPITALQILFLNLVTDVFPALALGVGEGGKGVMDIPPRPPKEPIVTRRHWVEISAYGALLGLSTLAAFLVARYYLFADLDEETMWLKSITVAFLTLAFAQLFHVFNMRGPGSGIVSNEITRNRWVWGALALCTGLLVAAVYVPGLNDVLDATHPELAGWGLVMVAAVVPVVVDSVARLAYTPAPR